MMYSLLLTVLLTASFTESSQVAQDQTLPIQRHKSNIGIINREINTHLDKIRQSGDQEVSLIDELKQLNDKLSMQKQRVTSLQKRLDSQEELLNLKKQEQQQAERVKMKIRQHLQKRLRSFYLMGRTGFLNVTFSDKSLPDLMLFNDSFKQLLEYDQAVIDTYHDAIDQLNQAKEALKIERTLLQDFIRQAKKEQQALDDIRSRKNQMLTQVRSKKGLYEQAVREMQRAELSLTKTLTRLKQKEENRIRGFVLNKGKMAGPVIGNLTVRFGDQLENGPSNGITIETAEDEQVYSIYGGKVIFSGYKQGYGNMVIIDHGLQYYTITGRLDHSIVKEGDQVQAQEKIGSTGDIATLFSKGLYFEIRQGSTPIDPLLWLRPDSYPKQIELPLPEIHPEPENTSTDKPKTVPVE